MNIPSKLRLIEDIDSVNELYGGGDALVSNSRHLFKWPKSPKSNVVSEVGDMPRSVADRLERGSLSRASVGKGSLGRFSVATDISAR